MKKYKNSHFLANFVIFRYFFRISGAKPDMGDFVIFSDFFRISRLEGFLYSLAPQGDRNLRVPKQTGTKMPGFQKSNNLQF